MANRSHGAALRQLQRLFERGSLGGLSEWQMLERFARVRDESAFEALVARHGPMVLGVCRRVLDDPHAADDAFQATFLVLVRKAGSLRPRGALGHWLHGVAWRVALRARSHAAHRRHRERPVEGAAAAATVRGDEPGAGELGAVLDEELRRLPAKYRAPVVLCYLEGLTHEEAARQLGWPIGSVKGRLARARELLRGRLAHRGVVPAAALFAGTLGGSLSAAVPDALLAATLRTALALPLALGPAAAGAVPLTVVRLTEGVLSAMFLSKVKLAATIVGACGCLAFGAWELGRSTHGDSPAAFEERPETLPSSAPHTSPAAARAESLRSALEKPLPLALPNARLEDALKEIKRATQNADYTGVPIYVDPAGLAEAGATVDSPIALDATKVPLRSALDHALRPLKLAATVRDGLLVVSSRAEVTLIELRTLNEQLRRIAPGAEGVSGPGGAEGMSPAAWLKRIQNLPTVYSADYDEEVNPAVEMTTQAIIAALGKPVEMPFKDETALEDAVKYIQEQTKSPKLPDGIPIYVDPVGLNEAEKTMTSPVVLAMKGPPLKESLRLMLKQIGMTYTVKGGLLTITSEISEEQPTSTPIQQLADRATRGELSLREMNDLIELFRTRAKVMLYAAGLPSDSFDRPMVPKYLRPGAAATGTEDDSQTRLILEALERTAPLHFESTSLKEVMKRIRELTGIPSYLPRMYEPYTIELNLGPVKLRTALRLLLAQHGLTYTVEDGLLIVAKSGAQELAH